MNEPQESPDTHAAGGTDEGSSALFAHLVIQQSSMAMMLLGKSPHPETGKVVQDLEAAKLFIDQLEMLERKTKGNLSSEEAALLKQSLMSLRMAFVEAVDSPAEAAKDTPPAAPAAEPAPQPDASQSKQPSAADEHRTRFTKKY